MACVSQNFGASMRIGLQHVSSQRQFPNKISQIFFLQPRSFRSSKFSNFKNYNRLNRHQSYTTIFNSVSSDHGVSEERVSVLVIGGGGREHSLCYALKRSQSCDVVFCAPGNAGISNSGDATCIEDLDIFDSSAVIAFCRKWGVGLVVVGPEAPLVSGLTNDLLKAGIHAFGPSSEAAALEGSKSFMKSLCDKYGIPTAKVTTIHQNGWGDPQTFYPSFFVNFIIIMLLNMITQTIGEAAPNPIVIVCNVLQNFLLYVSGDLKIN